MEHMGDILRRRAAHVALLAALAAAMFFPKLGQDTLIKGHEDRHSLIALTMLETGEYAVPYVLGKPYIDKPPLFNWVVAGFFRLFGHASIGVARIPSALSATVIVLLIYVLGRRWATPRAGLLGAVAWSTSWTVLEWARFARMDMLMAMLVLCGIVLADSAAMANGRRRATYWCLACAFIGLSWLAKCPMGFFFFALAATAIWKARTGRWFVGTKLIAAGLPVALVPFAAWAVAAEAVQPGQLKAMFGYVGGEGFVQHRETVFLYLEQLSVQTLPWSIFAIGACYYVWRTVRKNRFGVSAIPAAVSIAAIVIMSAFPNKRIHYALPIVPLWCLFLGAYIDSALQARTSGQGEGAVSVPKWAFEWAIGGSTVGLVVVLGGLMYYIGTRPLESWPAAALVSLSAGTSTVGCVALMRHNVKVAASALAGALIVLAFSGYTVLLPFLQEPEPKVKAVAEIAANIPAGATVADFSCRDELLSFELNRRISYVDTAGQLRELLGRTARVYVLAKRKDVRLVAGLGGGARVAGMWKTKGLDVALVVVDAGAAQGRSTAEGS